MCIRDRFLSGHGNFNAYIHRMRKVQSTECQYDDSPHEDALCTFYKCRREGWMALVMKLGEFTPEGVVELMLQGKMDWDRISEFVQWVLLEKIRQTQLALNGQYKICLLYTSRCV